MNRVPSRNGWYPWNWLRSWSWTERVIALVAVLAPVITLAFARVGQPWLVGVLSLAALTTVHGIVWRHGGWGLLGPHFYYDVVRLARRGRSTALRVGYLVALLIGLMFVYETIPQQRVWRHNDLPRVAQRFTFALFLVQNLALLVLAPAYLGSAVAEERERRTLELLFTTRLSDREIILGKLGSRLLHLVGFVLAGFPVVSVILLWGGLDILVLLGNLANTLFNIVSVGSICLLASTLARTVRVAVMTSYVLILPTALGCMTFLGGAPFVLQDARTGITGQITIQDLVPLAIVHAILSVVCVGLAVVVLRDRAPMPPRPIDEATWRHALAGSRQYRWSSRSGTRRAASRAALAEREALLARPREPAPEPLRLDVLAVAYLLPPVPDNALLWKERYLGGPSIAFSPVMLVPMIPFLISGIMYLAFWVLRGFFVSTKEYEEMLVQRSHVLQFFYFAFLGYYLLGVAFRATASIALERQQQTLEALLLLPIARREILVAKWLGSLMRGWPWLALLVMNIALGAAVGAYRPVSAILMLAAPGPVILFFASLGLYLSVTMGTVLRANLAMVIFLLPLLLWVPGVGVDWELVYVSMYVSAHELVFSWVGMELPSFHWVHLTCAFTLFALFLFGAWALWKLALNVFDSPCRVPTQNRTTGS